MFILHNQQIQDITSPDDFSDFDPYIHLVNNKFIIDLPNNNNFDAKRVEAVETMLSECNLTLENQNNIKPFQSDNLFGIRSGVKYPGSNGYAYRDKKGHWHYVVTKGAMETVVGCINSGVVALPGTGGTNWSNK